MGDSIIDEVDLSKDHKIDYNEFLGLWDESFDKVRRKNLREVRKKRLVRDNKFLKAPVEEGEDGSFLKAGSPAKKSSSVSNDSAPPGAGKYYFEQEKEKS